MGEEKMKIFQLFLDLGVPVARLRDGFERERESSKPSGVYSVQQGETERKRVEWS